MGKMMQFIRQLAGCAILALPALAAAQTNDLQLPVIIDADRTDYDGKTSMLMFTNLRLAQGGIGIEADTAQASRMDFDDSVWQFSGNVVFDVNEGRVTCDAADLKFADFQLQSASIKGSPATFEFRRPGQDQSTFAEAGALDYDVARGVIEFSGGATITEGGNQISSESLVYNIREQRIQVTSSVSCEDRVKVTYAPTDSKTGADEQPASEPADDPVITDAPEERGE